MRHLPSIGNERSTTNLLHLEMWQLSGIQVMRHANYFSTRRKKESCEKKKKKGDKKTGDSNFPEYFPEGMSFCKDPRLFFRFWDSRPLGK